MVRLEMRGLLALLSSALLLTACFFPADRGRLLESRVDVLAQANRDLHTQLEDTRTQLQDTATKLQAALDQLDTASRTTGANIGVKVDGTLQDVAELRGQLESQQHRLLELEQKLASTTATTGPASPTSVEPKPEPLKRPDEPKAFFELAADKAKAGDIDLARRLYAEFIKKWPREERTGDAHFALGETYFSAKQCREALYEYGKVIQDFPKSKAAPNAYLRSSECFKDLKMSAEAKVALEELLRQHPKSEAASTAKQRLADYKKKGSSK